MPDTNNISVYLEPTGFIDFDKLSVRDYAETISSGARDEIERAVLIYRAVRDDIRYDPYYVAEDPRYFCASACLQARRGFCVPKSTLMAACARATGIPARLGFADVRNHLTTKRLTDLVGSDIFVWHSYVELHLDNRWVKATPTFNRQLCERFNVQELDFDGRNDSLFQEFDHDGRRYMEYIRFRGSYPDVPYDRIITSYRKDLGKWLEHALDYKEGM